MKHVLIVVNGYGLAGGIEHQVKRLKEEFSKRGVEVEWNDGIIRILVTRK